MAKDVTRRRRREGAVAGALRGVRVVEVLVRAKTALRELVVSAGLQVLGAMLEEDREVLCGPRHHQNPARDATRYGFDEGSLVLGGRRVGFRRPRVRRGKREVPLPTWEELSREDPLQERAVEQMLVGVSTRDYARSLEPLPAGLEQSGVSRSSVSRRFVARHLSSILCLASFTPRSRSAIRTSH
jgi:hypothetical protein